MGTPVPRQPGFGLAFVDERTPATLPAKTITCRFCGAEATLAFTASALTRHPMGYYRCSGCESLLTSEPTWLAEAYSDSCRPTDLDAAADERAADW